MLACGYLLLADMDTGGGYPPRALTCGGVASSGCCGRAARGGSRAGLGGRGRPRGGVRVGVPPAGRRLFAAGRLAARRGASAGCVCSHRNKRGAGHGSEEGHEGIAMCGLLQPTLSQDLALIMDGKGAPPGRPMRSWRIDLILLSLASGTMPPIRAHAWNGAPQLR
jgi:hypothetical protein